MPLILDVDDEVKGALVGIVPFEHLAASAFAKLEPSNILTFAREAETILTQSQVELTLSEADLITQDTPFVIPNSEHGQAITYRLRLAEPTQIRFAGVRATLVKLVLSILAAVVILVVFAYFFARWVVSPLGKLADMVHAYADGNYEIRPPSVLFVEIQDFVTTLQHMGQQIRAQLTALRDSQDQLAEANQTLERRVADRTEQLAQVNAAISDLNAQLRTENVRLGAEVDVARKLQHMLLPTGEELQQIQALDIACYMEASDEVGGDYYDVLQHNGQIKIGIGDVTGHGLESGVVMLMTQAIVRALLTSGENDPVRFLDILNRALYGNVQRMGSDKNMTLSLLDYTGGSVRLSGQHEETIVVRAGGTVEVIDTIDMGFPIGLADEIRDFVDQKTVALQPGDGVVLYTDGITEAENTAGVQYGLERLCQVISQQWAQPAEGIKAAVVADVHQHIGEQIMYDDITLVVMKQK